MGKNQFQSGEEKSMDEFMKELKVSGRYFVGNPQRQRYITVHRAEINSYLDSLGESDSREADRLASLVLLNSKSQPKRQINLDELMETRERLLSKSSTPLRRIITPYSSRLRKFAERLILPVVVVGAIAGAAYLGNKYVSQIEKMVLPYTEK